MVHRISFWFALLVALSRLAAGPALAQSNAKLEHLTDRYALVIGNGAYPTSPLRNPANDATDIAASLRAIGFGVSLYTDLDFRGMRAAIATFNSGLPNGAAALFFFAGHGVQFAGKNFILPTDAIGKLAVPKDLERVAIGLPWLINQMNTGRSGVSVVVLDACRNSPFTEYPDIGSGLARALPPRSASSSSKRKSGQYANIEGTLIAYSTAPEMTAADGSGRNSPYTKHLKDLLRRPDASMDTILRLTRAAVTRETSGEQTPWYESSLNADFYPGGRGRIAFEELLMLFVGPPEADPIKGAYYLQPWDMGSSDGSPISWRHEGAKFVDLSKRDYGITTPNWGEMVREGDVVITVDGSPTHYALRQRKEPVRWKITLFGARSGVAGVTITNTYLSHEFGGFGDSKVLRPKCEEGDSGFGSKVYEIVIPGRRTAWLATEFSCGSGGCTHDYAISYNEADLTSFRCQPKSRK